MEKNKSQIIIYQTESGQTKIDVRLEEDTVWLSQVQLDRGATVAKYAIVQMFGISERFKIKQYE